MECLASLASLIQGRLCTYPACSQSGDADRNRICDEEFTLPALLDSSLHSVSAHSRIPSLHTLKDSREAKEEYFGKCVPLYLAAQDGDWKGAKKIIKKDKTVLRACITKGWHTILHVAAGAGQVHFVSKLLEFLDVDDLVLQDQNGNTAFCFAVAAGALQVAMILLEKNPRQLEIRGGRGMTPLYFAALFGHSQMALYLYPKLIHRVDQGERTGIFFTSINNGLYELALEMFHDFPQLAVARNANSETALHLLAQKPSGFSTKISKLRKIFASSCTKQGNLKRTPCLQLLKSIWEEVLCQDDAIVTDVMTRPSHILFTATKLGNSEFVAELLRTYPDLIWETDESNRSLFHIAVMYHQASIFNMVHKLGIYKDFILSYKDDKNNNILHLAAKLAPVHGLNSLSTPPGLRMQQDLFWFKEVKKVVTPSYIEMKNSEGKTPRDVFIQEHQGLLENGEPWMKSNRHALFNSCCGTSIGCNGT